MPRTTTRHEVAAQCQAALDDLMPLLHGGDWVTTNPWYGFDVHAQDANGDPAGILRFSTEDPDEGLKIIVLDGRHNVTSIATFSTWGDDNFAATNHYVRELLRRLRAGR